VIPAEIRLQLLNAGFSPLPLSGKIPVMANWQTRDRTNPDEIRLWSATLLHALNTGILTRFTPCLDADLFDPDAAEAVEQLVRDRFGEHGSVLSRVGRPPRRAFPFRTDIPFPKIKCLFGELDTPEKDCEKLEFLCDGQQLVVDGIHPETRQPYYWPSGSVGEIRHGDLPFISSDEAKQLVADIVELLIAEHGYRLRDKPKAKAKTGNGHDTGGTDWPGFADLIDHDQLTAFAMKLLTGGLHAGAAVNMLRGLVGGLTGVDPDRKARRLAEIPSMAWSAQEKLNGARGASNPVPDSGTFVSWGDFSMGAKGLYLKKKPKDEEEEAEFIWIAAAFKILGVSRDPHGSSWGKWLSWIDADKRAHTRHVGDAALQGDPASLCAALADEGLHINRSQQRIFAAYLCGCTVEDRVTLVRRTGWHDIGNNHVFALPSETIGPHGAEHVILDASAIGPYAASGTLEDWQASLGTLSNGHFLPILAISAALAGPLLHLVGQEGGAVHFFGDSSKGKTTLLQSAASVWGRGSASGGYVRGWRATANGLEGAAASASDTVLVLDELGVLEAREAQAAIYGLANGAGKARAARDGSLREPKSWRILTLSCGEMPTESKLGEDRGKKARAGQLVRMLDISADRGKGFGVFDNAGPDGDAGKLAQKLKHDATLYYGAAGPEFVRRIINEDSNEIADHARRIVSDFITECAGVGCNGQISRAAQRLGLIAAAGELAIRLKIVPWQKDSALDAASWAFDRWIEGRGGMEPAEVRQAIQQVRLFIEQHGESRFDILDEPKKDYLGNEIEPKPVNNRAGWRKGSGKHREWMVPPQVWRSEICAGLDPTMVARTLEGFGMLHTQGGRGFQCQVNIGGNHRVRAYVLTSDILEGGDDAT
jgi:uncharacterized protein (DUF927 family)